MSYLFVIIILLYIFIFEKILIVLVLILILFTDFDELLFNILSNIFDLIKAAILFLKRIIVNTFCNFLYDILAEPIIYIFGIIKNSFK